jgi:rhamnogalacturonyl hydrolase YesR
VVGRGDQALAERIAAVADRSVKGPYVVWDWGEAVAIQALVVASRSLGEPRWEAWVGRQLELWRQIHPAPFWPDHLGPGVALIWHYERTGERAWLDYALRLGAHFASLPQTSTGALLLRPDKPDLRQFAWVDAVHTDGPFLCELSRVTGDPAWADLGATHIEGMCAHLQDPDTGLFAHRYDNASGTVNGVFWGRGCGWAALGLGHVLTVLPRTHPVWPRLATRLRALADAAGALQAESGHWHAVIDRPETLLESSTTALIGEGLALGIASGALDARYDRLIQCAWRATAAEVGPDGCAGNVSQRSPAGTAWQDYATLPHGGCYPWGQGPWLLFGCRFLDRAAHEVG